LPRKACSLPTSAAAMQGSSWRTLLCTSILTPMSVFADQASYPIRSGNNRVSWPNGCCEGDLIVIDFRDEQADGNAGTGMLSINNTSVEPNAIETYRIEGDLGYTWKSYGPFCAYEGWHNFSYTSDANPEETTFTITDSFGLIKAKGGMDSLPLRFHTTKPSKFCTPDGGLTDLQRKQRNVKLIAAHDQFKPRSQLLSEGFAVPQDVYPPLTVYDNTRSGHDHTRRAY
jgi:hypothetical protein